MKGIFAAGLISVALPLFVAAVHGFRCCSSWAHASTTEVE